MDHVWLELGDDAGKGGLGGAVVDHLGHLQRPGQQRAGLVIHRLGKAGGLGHIESVLGGREITHLMAVGGQHPPDLVEEHLGPALNGVVVVRQQHSHRPIP
jgi:hypothetical protein